MADRKHTFDTRRSFEKGQLLLKGHTNPKQQLKVPQLSILNVHRDEHKSTQAQAVAALPLLTPWEDAASAKGTWDSLRFSGAALDGSTDPVSMF